MQTVKVRHLSREIPRPWTFHRRRKRKGHEFVSSWNLSLLMGCRFTRFLKTHAFPFFLSRIVDEKSGLIGFSRSRCNVHGSFDRSSFSFQSGLRPRDTWTDLVYPDVFCGNILSYKIADIHRISIEMAADVAAAIGRRALSRPLRDASLRRSALLLVWFDRTQFYSNFSRLRRSHYYNAAPPVADSSIFNAPKSV